MQEDEIILDVEPEVEEEAPDILSQAAASASTDWQTYREFLSERFEFISVFAEQCDDGVIAGTSCWIPVPAPDKEYSLEWTHDGYARVRFLKSNEWILDRTGKPKLYKSKRSNGNVFYRKSRPRGTIYLAHLAYLFSGRKLQRRADYVSTTGEMRFNVWLTLSHLCGKRGCCNPDHIVLEPHRINLSRNQCCNEICVHEPDQCIRSADAIMGMVEKITSLFSEQI